MVGETWLQGKLGTPSSVLLANRSCRAACCIETQMVGVRLRVRKLPPHPAWKDNGERDRYKNLEVAGLFRVKCPKLDLDEKMGSVLVVRADGKNITPHQVEAHSREPITEMRNVASGNRASGLNWVKFVEGRVG